MNHVPDCSICGCLILFTSSPPSAAPVSQSRAWQSRVVLLSDPEREFEQLEEYYRAGKLVSPPPPFRFDRSLAIRRDAAFLDGANRLRLAQTIGGVSLDVHPNHIPGRDVNWEWNSTYYIAVHEACLSIADRLFTHLGQPSHLRFGVGRDCGISVRSVESLWKTLRMRFDALDNELMGGLNLMPDDVHPGISLRTGYYLHPSTGPGEVANDWATADPMHVKDLTTSLLQMLEDLPAPLPISSQHADFQTRCSSLPRELQDQVYSYLLWDKQLPMSCTGLLPPRLWMSLLFDRKYFPFLWDIDCHALDAFFSRVAQADMMNWELLVRSLSNGLWDSDNLSRIELKIPKGLRNRCRIWQIVAEMYICDVVPRQPSPDSYIAIPRYWDFNGKQMCPVRRIGHGRAFHIYFKAIQEQVGFELDTPGSNKVGR
ncbi:hypothetical protein F5Y16DRAFT_394268 [Xylariaceae sp. FL0255]|nr:hypothetical protein F5Y16DRAFT_394268 [Xylariaceae sp. FL0255]